jgi:hypothetical protein
MLMILTPEEEELGVPAISGLAGWGVKVMEA